MKFIKDPLFHFFFAAFIFYAIFSIFERNKQSNAEIIVLESEIEHLRSFWIQKYDKEPTISEFEALVKKLTLDKKIFKEALLRNLHLNDEEIFRLLVKKAKSDFKKIDFKMRIDKKTLKEYYKKHLKDYKKDANISFSHIFISIKNKNPINKADAIYKLLTECDIKPKDTDGFGDDFKPKNIENLDKKTVIKLFGKSFYKQIRAFKTDEWNKPIFSSKGIHIVYITNFQGGKTAPYKEVKELVKNDYIKDLKKRSYENILKTIDDKYDVSIITPPRNNLKHQEKEKKGGVRCE